MPFDSPGQRQPPIRQEEVAIKPYKRKTPATTSYDEEQIKPSASLYQTRPQTQRNANPKPAFKIPAYPRGTGLTLTTIIAVCLFVSGVAGEVPLL